MIYHFKIINHFIGKEEFLIDETIITEVTELPSTGEKWFKTTLPKDVEFRSYLKLEHRGMVWKKVYHPPG